MLHRFHVSLKEGKGADFKFKPHNLLQITIPAPKNRKLLAVNRVCQAIVKRAEHADDFVFQRKPPEHFHISFLVKPRLCRCNQINQQLTGPHASSYNQMAEHSLVGFFMIKGIPFLPAEIQRSQKHLIKVRMHQLTLIHCDNGHKPLFPVHSQGHLAALFHIAEGILHLIPIFELGWSRFDGQKLPAADFLFLKQAANLSLLHFQLFFIGNALIHAPSAELTMLTDFKFVFHLQFILPLASIETRLFPLHVLLSAYDPFCSVKPYSSKTDRADSAKLEFVPHERLNTPFPPPEPIICAVCILLVSTSRTVRFA